MYKFASRPNRTHGTVTGAQVSANAERPFVFADIRTAGAGYPPAPTIPSHLPCALG